MKREKEVEYGGRSEKELVSEMKYLSVSKVKIRSVIEMRTILSNFASDV